MNLKIRIYKIFYSIYQNYQFQFENISISEYIHFFSNFSNDNFIQFCQLSNIRSLEFSKIKIFQVSILQYWNFPTLQIFQLFS